MNKNYLLIVLSLLIIFIVSLSSVSAIDIDVASDTDLCDYDEDLYFNYDLNDDSFDYSSFYYVGGDCDEIPIELDDLDESDDWDDCDSEEISVIIFRDEDFEDDFGLEEGCDEFDDFDDDFLLDDDSIFDDEWDEEFDYWFDFDDDWEEEYDDSDLEDDFDYDLLLDEDLFDDFLLDDDWIFDEDLDDDFDFNMCCGCDDDSFYKTSYPGLNPPKSTRNSSFNKNHNSIGKKDNRVFAGALNKNYDEIMNLTHQNIGGAVTGGSESNPIINFIKSLLNLLLIELMNI